MEGDLGEIYRQAAHIFPTLALSSVSLSQRRPLPDLPWVANVPNALDFSLYPCKPHRGDYLLFLGRMSADKGAHRAIAVAMETGLPLKLAGKRNEPSYLALIAGKIAELWKTTPEEAARLTTENARRLYHLYDDKTF